MQTLRLLFKKTGLARYTSHLDLNRAMQRALRRAGIPIWNTQGFNPHPFITFVLPLPLGCESICEKMDFRLDEGSSITPDEIVTRLNAALPEGIEAVKVYEPIRKAGELGFARYRFECVFEGMPEETLRGLYAKLLALPSVAVEKETKRGSKQLELKPIFEKGMVVFAENQLTLELILPAGAQESISPGCVPQALKQNGMEPAVCRMLRLEMMDLDGSEFN